MSNPQILFVFPFLCAISFLLYLIVSAKLLVAKVEGNIVER